MMKKVYLYMIVAVALLQTVSCVKEPFDNGNSSETLDMRLRVATRTSSDPLEDVIDKVRIIVVNSNGTIKFNNVFSSAIHTDGEYPLTVLSGQSDFYVICNETADLAAKLAAVTRSQDIETLSFNYPSVVAPSFVMFGKVAGTVKKVGSNVYIDYGSLSNQEKLNVEVKRVAAKVSLSFIKESPGDNNFSVDNIRIQVFRLPAMGYVGGGNVYSADLWLNSYTGSTVKPSSSTVLMDNGTAIYNSTTQQFDVTAGDCVHMTNFYLPEYIVASPTGGTPGSYIMVTADVTVHSSIYVATWRININDGVGDHNIYRNTHYNIMAKIKGMGSMDLYAEIKMATTYNIVVGWKPIEGLVIVSDKSSDYGSNVDVWNNPFVYTGILKIYENTTYYDAVFKYGSVVCLDLVNGVYSSVAVRWKPSTFTAPTTAWDNIPYSSSGDVVSNTAENVAMGLGDPCKLVRLSAGQITAGMTDNNQWRMATREEMQRLLDADDRFDINYPATFTPDTRGYAAFHSKLLPSSNGRDQSGALTDVANTGGYWASTGGYAFTYNSTTNAGVISQPIYLNQALTVRCVRNTVPESSISFMNTVNPGSISYQGNTTTGSAFTITTNIPYWTATLITSGANVGNSTEFGDFSFRPFTVGDGTNVHQDDGLNTKTLRVYIARKEITAAQGDRTFHILVKGIGYDGRVIERVVTATQSYYRFYATPSVSSAQLTDGKFHQAGGTYTVTVNITPTDVALPAGGTLNVSAYFLSELKGTSTAQTIIPGVYTYTFSLPVAANGTPDVINIRIQPFIDLPNSISNNIYIYQANN